MAEEEDPFKELGELIGMSEESPPAGANASELAAEGAAAEGGGEADDPFSEIEAMLAGGGPAVADGGGGAAAEGADAESQDRGEAAASPVDLDGMEAELNSLSDDAPEER